MAQGEKQEAITFDEDTINMSYDESDRAERDAGNSELLDEGDEEALTDETEKLEAEGEPLAEEEEASEMELEDEETEAEEENEEDQEEDQEEGQAEDQEDGEDIEPDDVFELLWQDKDGQEVSRDYSAAELTDIARRSEELEGAQEFVEQVTPFVSLVRGSELLKRTLAFKEKGFSDEQIMRHMAAEVNNASPEEKEPEEFESNEDMVQYLVQKEMKKFKQQQVEPLQNQLLQQQTQAQQKDNETHNASMFYNSVKKHGWDQLSPSQEAEAVKTMFDLYPGINGADVKFTQEQTNHIIKLGVGYNPETNPNIVSKRAKAKPKARKPMIENQVNAPNIMKGQPTIKPGKKKNLPIAAVTGLEERSANFAALFEVEKE